MERDSDRRPILLGRLLNSCFWSANWICGKQSGVFCKKHNRSIPRTQSLEQTPAPSQPCPRAQFLLFMRTGYGKLPILFHFSPASQDQRCHSRLLNLGTQMAGEHKSLGVHNRTTPDQEQPQEGKILTKLELQPGLCQD